MLKKVAIIILLLSSCKMRDDLINENDEFTVQQSAAVLSAVFGTLMLSSDDLLEAGCLVSVDENDMHRVLEECEAYFFEYLFPCDNTSSEVKISADVNF